MIRLANSADAERIGELWLEMVAYHAEFDPVMFRPSPHGAALYAQNVRERLEDPRARLLVAEAEGAVVGYASGLIADLTTGFFLPLRSGLLSDIFVAESHRRRGLGRALVERLALWFRDSGVRQFEWHVSADNEPALAFWAALDGKTTLLRMRAQIPEEGE